LTFTIDTNGNNRYSAFFGLNTTTALDSDNDGVPDAFDAFPFDPTRWIAPNADPSDTTPPTITITEP
jgi:hypothetical protein